jgi:predicted SAM-dependent methyltransferase
VGGAAVSYTLPFQQGQKLIELGGGAQPIVHPNVDVRQCYDTENRPTVDFMADFNKPLPITSDEWDGLFAKFVLEHVSWREVRGFITEIHRILKTGGTAVLVVPNLLEQARKLVEIGDSGEWEDRWVCMVFGDLDYPENSHKCGFSPEFACRLFREAGFSRVLIVPYGELKTDMIIEATK